MIEFQRAPASLPPGRRIYAVGDIHGAHAQLLALHAHIAQDLAARPVPSVLLLHLGDYVDKGEQSRAVVDHLAAGPPIPGLPTLNLIGNHEDTMLAALAGDGGAIADWLWCGGRPTLASWGCDPEAPATWPDAFTPKQRAFLDGLALHYAEGGYLFVHAGIRPGIPLAAQRRDDLLRIRHDFLNSERDHGAVVVHGHTAGFAPVVRHNRIGLDTAAWSGGPLTCAVLEDDRLGFLQA